MAAVHLDRPFGAEHAHLYRNEGDGTFAEVSAETGLDRVILVMGANFGDLDGDGWLDAYFGTGMPDMRTLMPNRMYRNDGGRRFQDVTASGGFGHLQKGHGVSFGDLDGDGDQDVHQVLGAAFEGDVYENVLLENPGHGNHWLTLHLEGVRSNRDALGARVRVRVRRPAGDRAGHPRHRGHRRQLRLLPLPPGDRPGGRGGGGPGGGDLAGHGAGAALRGPFP